MTFTDFWAAWPRHLMENRMKRKPKPIHQQARDKKLTPDDARELEMFRTFLRDPSGNRQLAYERIYGAKK